MRAFLYVHKVGHPFAPLREIRTATDIDRLRPLSGPGTLSFRCAPTEVLTHIYVNRDHMLREGDALVDRSTEGIAPWLWYVTRISDQLRDGMVDVEAEEWRGLLYQRQVPLSFTAGGRSAAQVARDLLRAVNGRHPTHILPLRSTVGPDAAVLRPLPADDLSLGGSSLGEAFDELALRTDSEWWVDYQVEWGCVTPYLRWGYRRGLDRSERVVMDGRYHLTDAIYSRDARGVAESVQIMGGGDDPATAPSGTLTVDAAAAATSEPGGGRKEAAPELSSRLSLKRGPRATVGEAFDVRLSETSEAALISATRTRQKLPVVALESIEPTLRYVPDIWFLAGSGIARFWSSFDLGDVVRLRLTNARFGLGVDLFARVTAMQPDEATGEMPVTMEVQQGTVSFMRGIE